MPNKKKKEIDHEKIEQEKKFLMWAGVSFFMALILTIWFFNIKTIFKTTQADEEDQFDWQEITAEFEKTMEQIKTDFDEIKEITEEETIDNSEQTTDNSNDTTLVGEINGEIDNSGEIVENIATSTATSSLENFDFNKEEVEMLKKKLEELEGNF